MSDLKETIKLELLKATKDKNTIVRDTLRLALSEIKKNEIATNSSLSSPSQITSIIQKMIKQRQESISIYEKAERKDLADKEKNEVNVLQKYLPKQLTSEEVLTAISDAITSTNAKELKDMGQVMSNLKQKIQGRADMGEVSKKVRDILSS